jgi:hypothetical protein
MASDGLWYGVEMLDRPAYRRSRPLADGPPTIPADSLEMTVSKRV